MSHWLAPFVECKTRTDDHMSGRAGVVLVVLFDHRDQFPPRLANPARGAVGRVNLRIGIEKRHLEPVERLVKLLTPGVVVSAPLAGAHVVG